jgi:alpha-glucosidase
VYLRSFADGNGDGIGDLEGVRTRLGYLELLGVDTVWLTPFYPSPMTALGTDISDPRGIDPMFGNLALFDQLIAEATEHGIRVVIDLVPNRTSDRHPWFVDALAARPGSHERNRYVFRDGHGDAPPNNWTTQHGGPAWTRIADGQWFLHLCSPDQPDVNWANPDIAIDLERTLRFWLQRGISGFRIDLAYAVARPNADPRTDDDSVHEVNRMIRRVLEEYPGCVAIAEIADSDSKRFTGFLRPDELHLGIDTRLSDAAFDADQVRWAIEHSMAAVTPVEAPASWTLSRPDLVRHATRYGRGDGSVGNRRARAMAVVELALPGSIFLYNGEELGLPDLLLPDWALRDPIWELSGRTLRGRDGCRVPLPWEGDEPPFGFTNGQQTWLPMPAEWAPLTVEQQLEDPDSMLSLYRHAIELRQTHDAFRGNEIEWYGAPPGCFAFRRKDGGLTCALNTSGSPVPLPAGEILLSSGAAEPGQLPAETAVWLI